MKIAIAGAHFVGKTTLAQALAERLAGHAYVEEPYHQLAGDGHDVADVPGVDDFAEQLRVSAASIAAAGDAVFDRSPLDFLAYALSLKDRDPIDQDEWLEAIADGLAGLDLLVLCPIEEPDRIAVPAGEDRALRRAVDRRLKAMILDDSLGVLAGAVVTTMDVGGDLAARLRQVLAAAGRRP